MSTLGNPELGKPTAFSTVSANETQWLDLVRTLYRSWNRSQIQNEDIDDNEIFQKLGKFQRASLVAEDPIVCSIHFYKLVRELMNMLGTKKNYRRLIVLSAKVV